MDIPEGLLQKLFTYGLVNVRHCAQRQTTTTVFIAADDMHWNMPRQRFMLEAVKNRPTHHVRQRDIESYCSWLELPRKRKRRHTTQGHQRLQTLLVRHIDENARKGHIIFDDQDYRISRMD